MRTAPLRYNHPDRLSIMTPFISDVIMYIQAGDLHNSDAVLLAAHCVANSTYQCSDMQNALLEEGVLDALRAALTRSTRKDEVLALLRAYLNTSYNSNPFPIKTPEDLKRILKPALELPLNAHDSIKVGNMVSVYLFKAGLHAGWAADLCDLAHKVCTPLVKKGRELTATMPEQCSEDALNQMVNAPGGDAVAANFFHVAAVSRECLSAWTLTFWLGRRSTDVDEEQDAAVAAGPQPIAAHNVDAICRAGLAPGVVASLGALEREHLDQAGVLRFMLDRYAMYVKAADAEFASRDIFTAAFREKFLAWLTSSKEEGPVSEQDVDDWFTAHVTAAAALERGVPVGDAVAAAHQSHRDGTFALLHCGRKQPVRVVTCRSTDGTERGALTGAIPAASRALAASGLGALARGRKRWYHGCSGDKGCRVLDDSVRTDGCTIDAQDVGRETFYLFETFEHAWHHAIRRECNKKTAVGFPRDAPTVLVFDVDEAEMNRYVLSNPQSALHNG
jgi:hypothetical protein